MENQNVVSDLFFGKELPNAPLRFFYVRI